MRHRGLLLMESVSTPTNSGIRGRTAASPASASWNVPEPHTGSVTPAPRWSFASPPTAGTHLQPEEQRPRPRSAGCSEGSAALGSAASQGRSSRNERERSGRGTSLICPLLTPQIFTECVLSAKQAAGNKRLMGRGKDSSLCPCGSKTLFKRQMLIAKCKHMCRLSNHD